MSTQRKKSGGPAAEPATSGAASASRTKKAPARKAGGDDAAAEAPEAKKSAAQSAAAKAAAKKAAPAPAAGAAAKKSAVKKAAPAPRQSARKTEPEEPSEVPAALTGPVEDPIGDLSDGEARHLIRPDAETESAEDMMEAYRADTSSDAEQGLPETEAGQRAREGKARKRSRTKAAVVPAKSDFESAGEEPSALQVEPVAEDEDAEAEGDSGPRPEPHLERLQKILSQAGIASRRHAEEMIVAGRVIVNGQVVNQLGAKADLERDHIRVDGKLLQGAARHRTFVLNKPKGFVTTVSDPEGRPTVMQFFAKLHERLYPVGRLDYQSEGLLLMTNDGELANLLTRAASGVEKTYLVKLAGQPGEDAIERLRAGVRIDREQPGSGKVHTAPASIRQFRAGENPWYEVILTEGRNRELRKMFNAIGHFVEKIRRVGYGPLVLDVEPGQIRELTAEEIDALRLTAEGKLKPRRPKNWPMPKEGGRSGGERYEARGQRPRESRPPGAFRPREDKPFRPREDRPFRSREERGGQGQGRFEKRPSGDRPFGNRPLRDFDRGGRSSFSGQRPERADRTDRPERPQRNGAGGFEDRRGPGFREGGRGERPRFQPRSDGKPRFDREAAGARGTFRPDRDRGSFRSEGGRAPFRGEERPPRREAGPRGSGGPRREGGPRANGAPRFDRPNRSGGGEGRGFNRPEGRREGRSGERPEGRREGFSRPEGDRERRPGFGQRGSGPRQGSGSRSGFGQRPAGNRPFGGERRGPQKRGGGPGSRPGGFRRGGPPRRGGGDRNS